MIRLLLAAVMALLTLSSCEFEEIEREIGYKGKARLNPWLAAERFNSRMGRETRSVMTWSAPDWEHSVWIVPAVTLNNVSYIRQAEEWVENGGHLILLVENADAESNDWSGHYPKPEFEPPFSDFLKRSGIDFKPSHRVTFHELAFGGRSYKASGNSNFGVAELAGRGGAEHDPSKPAEPGGLVSVQRGEGRLSVLTDARIFRNRWIGDHEHTALLDAMIEAGGYDGAVVFMRGTGLSLWGMLSRYLWPVLLGLAVWLALWLWKNLTRFGPIEEAAAPSELRGYEHHLEALGDFQWRLDRAASLLAPLRAQIVELGQRASVQAGRRDDDFFQFLADRAGITRERVFRALAEAAPADASILTRTTADLQQLLKVLHHPSSS